MCVLQAAAGGRTAICAGRAELVGAQVTAEVNWLRLQHSSGYLSECPGPAYAADPSLAHWLKTWKLARSAVGVIKQLPPLQCRPASDPALALPEGWTTCNEALQGPGVCALSSWAAPWVTVPQGSDISLVLVSCFPQPWACVGFCVSLCIPGYTFHASCVATISFHFALYVSHLLSLAHYFSPVFTYWC